MAAARTTVIELGITNKEYSGEDRRGVLEIHTDKSSSGGLYTRASVYWVGDGVKSCTVFSDFSKRLGTTDRSVKATQKAIDTHHALVTPEAIETLKQEALAFYAGKETVTA